jgi:DnaJ-class molecular chaperone
MRPHNPFNIHTTGTGSGSGQAANNNRRRWASAFGGGGNSDSDEDMFTAGAPGSDPFAAFSMGAKGSGSFFQQQQQQPGYRGHWGGSSSSSSSGGHPFGFGGHHQQQQQQQQPTPQMVALPLTLEELYSGCTKRLKVRAGHVLFAYCWGGADGFCNS